MGTEGGPGGCWPPPPPAPRSPRPPTLAALVAVPRVVGLLVVAGLAAVAARRLRSPGPGGGSRREPGRGSGGLKPSPPVGRGSGGLKPSPPVGRGSGGLKPSPPVGRGSGGLKPSPPVGRGSGGPAVAAWALAVAWPLAVFAMVAFYDGNGGHTHPRYLFPGLAVLAVVAALGQDGLPGARLGLWIAAVTLAQLALTGVAWAGFVTASRSRRPSDPFDLLGAVAGMLDAAGRRGCCSAWPGPPGRTTRPRPPGFLSPRRWRRGSDHEPDGERVPVGLAVVGPDRRDDRQDQPGDRDRREQQYPDHHDDQDGAGDDVDEHREVEVQRLAALVGDERVLVLLDQVDDQRAEPVEADDQPSQGRQVGDHRPLAGVGVGGPRRRRARGRPRRGRRCRGRAGGPGLGRRGRRCRGRAGGPGLGRRRRRCRRRRRRARRWGGAAWLLARRRGGRFAHVLLLSVLSCAPGAGAPRQPSHPGGSL